HLLTSSFPLLMSHQHLITTSRTIYPLLLSPFFFLLIPPPPRSTLFPYTTLFRSATNNSARRFIRESLLGSLPAHLPLVPCKCADCGGARYVRVGPRSPTSHARRAAS